MTVYQKSLSLLSYSCANFNRILLWHPYSTSVQQILHNFYIYNSIHLKFYMYYLPWYKHLIVFIVLSPKLKSNVYISLISIFTCTCSNTWATVHHLRKFFKLMLLTNSSNWYFWLIARNWMEDLFSRHKII